MFTLRAKLQKDRTEIQYFRNVGCRHEYLYGVHSRHFNTILIVVIIFDRLVARDVQRLWFARLPPPDHLPRNIYKYYFASSDAAGTRATVM